MCARAKLECKATRFSARRYGSERGRCDQPGTRCSIVRVQVAPPSNVVAATTPFDSPLDQRPCCRTATMLAALSGLTAACGSTSALRYSVPPSAPPAQLATKGVSLPNRRVPNQRRQNGGGRLRSWRRGPAETMVQRHRNRPATDQCGGNNAVENSQRPAVIDISHSLV